MLIKNRSNTYDFSFNLVFVTKHRKEVFVNDDLRNEMKDYLKAIAFKKNVRVEKIEVFVDYVDMQISFQPDVAPASVVKSLKGTSARMWFKAHPDIKDELWDGHLWSPSYFMATVGSVSSDTIDKYVADQIQKQVHPKRK